MNELVSVIIPTYKRNDRLREAIDSVVNQTYVNLEIIIVDDNDPSSSYRKETENLMMQYKDNKKIRYIQHSENTGGAIARNTGISQAGGEYIAFLDDDDIYLPEKIEKQYEVFQKHTGEKLGLVYCYVQGIDDARNTLWNSFNDYEGTPLYEQMLCCIAGTSLWLCPKKALLDVGGFIRSPNKQDSILLTKLLGEGYTVYRVPEILVLYNDDPHNVKVSGINRKNIEGILLLRQISRDYYHLLSKKQAKKVEINFSSTLVNYYARLNEPKKALHEFASLLRLSPFLLNNLKLLIKTIYLTLNYQARK